MRIRLLCAAACIATAGSAAAQLRLDQIGSVDLNIATDPTSSSYIGTNLSAVAWNGADLFVAGFNNGVATTNIGILKIDGALGTTTIGPRFAVLDTPVLRGYSGLDIQNGVLAAAYDDGAVDANGITLWDLSGAPLWSKTARGGSGVGFDPGFPGGNPAAGEGTGWTTFGSGRRALQNTVTGADIWDTTTGMIVLADGGTFWRDMDFDDQTGDVWLREANNVVRAARSGDNATSSSTLVFDPVDADFINGQNVAYMSNPFIDLVIFNDRGTSTLGQSFFDVVKVITPGGTTVNIDWGTYAPDTASGYYDFSWDPGTRTLAIVDFNNRKVDIFELIPGGIGSAYCFGDGVGSPCPCGNELPATTGGCANSLGLGGVLQAAGSESVGADSQEFTGSNLRPNQPALLFVGNNAVASGNGVIFGDGLRCAGQGVVRLGVRTPDSSGTAVWGPGLGAQGGWMAGDQRFFQGWYRDPGIASPCGSGFNLTNGLSITFIP